MQRGRAFFLFRTDWGGAPTILSVVPAQAGTQGVHRHPVRDSRVPACAGTTDEDGSGG
ncbi:exported hypothetical protein [Magnetospirillum sp. UT-4]|nr:exported hypothetical protein [Magnetospirillum sp. UT-4]